MNDELNYNNLENRIKSLEDKFSYFFWALVGGIVGFIAFLWYSLK